MERIVISGTLSEPLTAEDYDTLFDMLMQLGIENISITNEEPTLDK